MANWQWFHRLGSPKWLLHTLNRWLPWLLGAGLVLLIIALAWGLAFVPPDYKQGNSFRIIYIHVPTAVVALAAYYMMAIAGAIAIVWRMKVADMALRAIAPVGAALTLLALLTGGIWGKPTWGAYWVWQDARLTSMLILFFLYIGVIALYDAYRERRNGNRAAAVLALVGTVNIPIIYKSVDWWSSLHQPASIKFSEPAAIAPEMLQPLLLAIAATYLLFAALVVLQLRVQIVLNEQRSQWLGQYAQQLLRGRKSAAAAPHK
ncbi:MAG: heme ABC transporter permease CcmC [Gammaproteobacteria bacterium]|nr:heme ABC transporter permease CcmC [Gammaproteobacteria bacterium]